MPRFLAVVPFWLWPLLGLLLLALAVPGYKDAQERKMREAALALPQPEIVDLEMFNLVEHVGQAGEVHVFAQANTEYQFLINTPNGTPAYVMPLFSAVAGPKEKKVTHVVLSEETERFATWLKSAEVGTARMGSLYEVNGLLSSGQGYLAAMRLAFRDAGLEQAAAPIVIAPFAAGRVAGLTGKTRFTFGNPVVLAASGIWMIWFGFVVWSRGRQLNHSVKRRMGEIGDMTSDEDGENRSRMKRVSRQLTESETALASSHIKGGITPAE